jgi:hypothetical protein
MTIRLIGLNHGYQLRGCREADWSAFEQYLLSYSVLEGIDLIAEELSDEAVRKWKAEDSVARCVASRLGIRHLFCDPESSEREALGIRSLSEIVDSFGPRPTVDEVEAQEREEWRIREQYWWRKLRDVSFTTGTFLLGSQHAGRFKALLLSEGCDAAIVEKNWSPNHGKQPTAFGRG